MGYFADQAVLINQAQAQAQALVKLKVPMMLQVLWVAPRVARFVIVFP
jgi:hypothetical protein